MYNVGDKVNITKFNAMETNLFGEITQVLQDRVIVNVQGKMHEVMINSFDDSFKVINQEIEKEHEDKDIALVELVEKLSNKYPNDIKFTMGMALMNLLSEEYDLDKAILFLKQSKKKLK